MQEPSSKRIPALSTIASMQAADARLVTTLYSVFYVLLLSALIYLFYSSPLRERIENGLYDLRSRLAPTEAGDAYAGIVGISEKNIKNLDGPDAKELSYASLIKIVNASLASEPKSVVVLLTSQVFPYDSAGLTELAKLAAADQRVILGVFGLDPTALLPEALEPIRSRVAIADLDRNFRSGVIRTIQIAKPKSSKDLQTLTLFLANSVDSHLGENLLATSAITAGGTGAEFWVNWRGKPTKTDVDAAELVQAGQDNALKNKIVFVGYTAFRPTSVGHREATFVNSPWQKEGDDPGNGIPIVSALTTAMYNAIDESWLRPVPASVPVIQTVIVSTIALLVWYLGSGLAAFSFLAGWTVLIYVHSVLFTFANIYVPMADTLLFSCMATTVGGLWRIRVEARLRAAMEAQEHSELQISQVQDRFLDRFAHELSNLNEKVRTRLAKHHKLASGSGTVQKIYAKAISSSDELAEYLDGIKQFASTRTPSGSKPVQKPFLIEPLLAKVLRQFDARKFDAGVDVSTRTIIQGKAISVLADPILTSQILYNLISNGIKYSPKGSKVEIIVTNSDEYIDVTVRDKGPGIPQEFHERIFEKFYRVKDDYVYKVKGHGLGLYLSRFFADQMGAKIFIQSAPTNGSSFTLRLPSTQTNEDVDQ